MVVGDAIEDGAEGANHFRKDDLAQPVLHFHQRAEFQYGGAVHERGRAAGAGLHDDAEELEIGL